MERTECVNDKNIYADVIIDISHEKVDRPFQYRIPNHLLDKVSVGVGVFVPFGKGNTLRKGYVIGLSDIPTFDEDKIKVIDAVSEKGEDVNEKLKLDKNLLMIGSVLPDLNKNKFNHSISHFKTNPKNHQFYIQLAQNMLAIYLESKQKLYFDCRSMRIGFSMSYYEHCL